MAVADEGELVHAVGQILQPQAHACSIHQWQALQALNIPGDGFAQLQRLCGIQLLQSSIRRLQREQCRLDVAGQE